MLRLLMDWWNVGAKVVDLYVRGEEEHAVQM
jgi:hypothetical protein